MPTKTPNALAYWRSRAGMKQRDVARRLGITNVAMSLMETGRERPTLAEVRALCRLYRCKPEDLYAGSHLQSVLGAEE